MDDQNEKTPKVNGEAQAPATSAGLSRRALLSGAGKVAIPTIVTLYSGAALARSSNLISADTTPGAEQGKYRCLDTSSVYKTNKPNVYDLGKDPMGHVTRIRSDKKYVKIGSDGKATNTQVDPKKMCADGGNYFRKDNSDYKRVTVRKGAMLSATALSSFANDITYTDV